MFYFRNETKGSKGEKKKNKGYLGLRERPQGMVDGCHRVCGQAYMRWAALRKLRAGE